MLWWVWCVTSVMCEADRDWGEVVTLHVDLCEMDTLAHGGRDLCQLVVPETQTRFSAQYTSTCIYIVYIISGCVQTQGGREGGREREKPQQMHKFLECHSSYELLTTSNRRLSLEWASIEIKKFLGESSLLAFWHSNQSATPTGWEMGSGCKVQSQWLITT